MSSKVRHVWPAYDVSVLPAFTPLASHNRRYRCTSKNYLGRKSRQDFMTPLLFVAQPLLAVRPFQTPLTGRGPPATSHYGTIGTTTAEGRDLS